MLRSGRNSNIRLYDALRADVDSLLLGVLLVWAAVMVPSGARAQQQYNNTDGYSCNGASKTCSTYALYRTFESGETLERVGSYFNATPASIANASGLQGPLSPRISFEQGQPFYIPLDCSCFNGTYQMPVPQVIISGDTFWLLSVTIYGGLTTYQAAMNKNPTLDAFNLQIGTELVVPIFCACPTAAQVAAGVNLLLTHTVYPPESLDVISWYYNITTAQLRAANELEENAFLGENTTLLVPLATLPPLSSLNLITPPSPPTPSPVKAAGKSKDLGLILGSLGGSLLAVCVLASAIYFLLRRRRARSVEAWDKEALAEMAGIPGFISYKHLSSATKQFSDQSKLGEGGFGSVYKGVLPKTGVPVAVKKVSNTSRQGEREFLAEVQIISQLRHRNVVELLGFCGDRGKFLLVYELLPKGSLDQALFKPKTAEDVLSWSQRWRIVSGTAAALHYLHEGWRWQVIHRDVKPSNIMLDEEFNPKLGDFGLARLVSHEDNAPTTNVAGTFGYIAPEATGGKFTDKTDVYAFGAVALEVACGRRVLDSGVENRDDLPLVDMVWRQLENGDLLSVADPLMLHEFDEEQMDKVLKVGLLCSHPNPASRPSMRQVVQVFAGDVEVPEMPCCEPALSFASSKCSLSIDDLLTSRGSSKSRSRGSNSSSTKMPSSY